MWNSVVDGQRLTFRLAGINNQNFIMRDEQTGTYWQQVSGQALFGPLKGKQLEMLPWDEVSFGVWKAEHPESLVLLPDPGSEDRYGPANWEEMVAEMPVALPADPNDELGQRDLVVGVEFEGRAKAYPMPVLVEQSPVIDRLGATTFALVVGSDGRSVRCFDLTVDGQALELFLKPDTEALVLIDTATGSEWDFSGKAVRGPLAGKELKRIQTLKDYWFDWKSYHPETAIYRAGQLLPGS